jgi:serine/threonine protein phosphatase PrpC
MEDTHLLLADLREETEEYEGERGCLVGVFDGHGGQLAATLARDNLLRVCEQAEALETGGQHMKEVYRQLDAQICGQCEELRDQSGCCAAIVLLQETQLIVSHCGDCRVVVADRNSALLHVTADHKPERRDEKSRVEAAGGFVNVHSEPDLAALHRKTPVQLAELSRVLDKGQATLQMLVGSVHIGRVMGTLGVSRSLGDVGFKNRKTALFAGKSFSADLVISEPEVALLDLSVHVGVFAIVACDGLWDVLIPAKAVAIVAELLRQHKSVKDCATALVERAIERGTLDNVTACVIQFPDQ